MKIVALLILFCIPSFAQDCKRVINADGSADFQCADGRWLGLTRKQLDEIQIKLNNGEAAQKTVAIQTAIIAEKDKQIANTDELTKIAQENAGLQKQIADSLRTDLDRSRETATRWQGLFNEERELRKEAQSFVPHGSKTKFDKFLSLFDSKGVQAAFKIGIPLFQTWRCN